MYIFKNGVMEIKEKSFIRKLFCKHEFVSGEHCSLIGLTVISGERRLTVCKKCGKVKESTFTRY